MNTNQKTISQYTWKERALVAVPLFLLVVGGLFVYGSRSTSPNVTASSTEEMKTAQTVSGSSTAVVPPGWTGRAPKMEVINGITVPPEPAPSINNATLAGVDVNNNGVRDDVERNIARQVNKPADMIAVIQFAKAYELIFSLPTTPTRVSALKVANAIFCAETKLGEVNATLKPGGNTEIVSNLFNNSPRGAKLSEYNIVLGGVSGDEVDCE